MAVENEVEMVRRGADNLDALIAERIDGPYALFFVTPEGEEFPDGAESESGMAIDQAGRIFSFWTAWDAERGEATLETWEQTEAEPFWSGIAEYRQARAAVGLREPSST